LPGPSLEGSGERTLPGEPCHERYFDQGEVGLLQQTLGNFSPRLIDQCLVGQSLFREPPL
jgi:hypothetical protein